MNNYFYVMDEYLDKLSRYLTHNKHGKKKAEYLNALKMKLKKLQFKIIKITHNSKFFPNIKILNEYQLILEALIIYTKEYAISHARSLQTNSNSTSSRLLMKHMEELKEYAQSQLRYLNNYKKSKKLIPYNIIFKQKFLPQENNSPYYKIEDSIHEIKQKKKIKKKIIYLPVSYSNLKFNKEPDPL